MPYYQTPMKHRDQFLARGGEMGRLIKSMDWSATSLGPIECWPQSLITTVSLCLASTFPVLIAWGPDTIQIYNDSYRLVCGDKHPMSMGQSFRVCWETALPVVGDAFTRGQSGEGTYIKDQRMFLDRNGYLEEAFMTFSFAPIRNEAGEVGGIFHTVTETTDKVLAARRTQVLRDLSTLIGKAETTEKICEAILGKTIDFSCDIPFLLLYQLDSKVNNHCVIAAAGIDADTAGVNWSFDEALQSLQPGVITDLGSHFGHIPFGPYPEAPHSAVVLPVNIAGEQRPWGFVVAGVSARRTLDETYLNFYELLGNAFSIAFSNVHAYEQAQQRNDALAAIDKAQTAANSPERAHVLIVDNNADMRNHLARLLEKYYYITTAKNGLEALEQVERKKPDLILSDIMMPVMNGKDLLERLRGNLATAQIPVIFLSARTGGEARIDGLEAGADDYLVKPFSAVELLTKVKSHIRILKLRNHAEQQLKNLFEQAPVAICLLKGLLMNIEVANEIQLQYWGRAAEEVMQKPLLEALPELKSQGMEGMIEKAYTSGKRYITGELPLKIIRFGKPEDIIVRITFEPLYEENGHVSGIMCVTNDITFFVAAREAARNYSDKLEQHVEDRTTALKVANEELKRTNRELEDFVFMSSHDLQEPLRKIQTFGNLAMSAEAARQPVREYLEKMIASASRMSGLIKDLLTYSKLNKNEDLFIETDLNVVMKNVLRDLEPDLKKRKAHIEISPLPRIKAVPLQMNQLFHNLLDNSLKFNDQEPVIRVSVSILSPEKQATVPKLETDKRYYELVFRDNGIGFEQKYADQVFTIFKRLVRVSDYPGSGIGLTICRKVVLNHGGYIYPESQLNEGCTFYVYLPVL